MKIKTTISRTVDPENFNPVLHIKLTLPLEFIVSDEIEKGSDYVENKILESIKEALHAAL